MLAAGLAGFGHVNPQGPGGQGGPHAVPTSQQQPGIAGMMQSPQQQQQFQKLKVGFALSRIHDIYK